MIFQFSGYNYGALIALFLVFGFWIIKTLFDVYVIRSTDKFIFKYGLYLPFDASESVVRFMFVSVIDAILSKNNFIFKLTVALNIARVELRTSTKLL